MLAVETPCFWSFKYKLQLPYYKWDYDPPQLISLQRLLISPQAITKVLSMAIGPSWLDFSCLLPAPVFLGYSDPATLALSLFLKIKQQKTSVGEDVEKLETLCIAGRNVKRYSHCRKQHGDPSKG